MFKNRVVTSCSISTNMERERYRCRIGNESISCSWHVAVCQCRRWRPWCQIWTW
uniref:Putative complex I intermediate-associated protein 30 n=1 Tax=Rhizophora mucronata TaxID=61149 RepID=A0A2P2JQ57_RHIMU